MDSAGQGRAQHVPLTGPWSVPVPLLRDELVSSWLVRNALANGCDPIVLTGCLWPGWRAWTVDIDRRIPGDRLATLADVCKAEPQDFSQATLEAVALKVSLKPLNPRAHWPWMLAVGSRNRLRGGGLQYCPACLGTGTAYFRVRWRFAWHTCCPIHHARLSSRCADCGMPIEPHRLEAADLTLRKCASCGGDLALAKAVPASGNALDFQTVADAAVETGKGTYDGEAIGTAEWFALAGFFVRLARRSARCETPALGRFGAAMGLEDKGVPTHAAQIELSDTADRTAMLGAAYVLLQAGRRRLFEALSGCGITRNGFRPKGEPFPACLAEVARALPPGRERKASRRPKPKCGLPPPRPRHEVERRAVRIARKVAGGGFA